MTPNQLRAEADESERLAKSISYQPHKAWLAATARELRRRAARLEQASWLPEDRNSGADERRH